LWKGLAAYLSHNRLRYLFGCCSLTSQEPAEGKRVMDYLRENNYINPMPEIRPQPNWECYPEGYEPDPGRPAEEVRLPKLFKLYLRYGAKVCGPPAIDRRFKTIDYLVLFDLKNLDAHSRATFFK